MTMMPLLAGLTTGITVWMMSFDGGRTERLGLLEESDARPAARMGIATALSSMSAFMRNGGTAVAALEDLAGRRFPTPAVTEGRAAEAFSIRRHDDETESQVRRVSRDVAMACRISERLGCETVRCLAAVSSSYARSRLVEDLKAKSLAMPQSTVRLLSALPVVTIMLGEVLGAEPVAFLVGSAAGLACLGAGAACYVAGLIWVDALLARLRDYDGEDDGQWAANGEYPTSGRQS